MTWDPVELDIARHADELGNEAAYETHIEEHRDEAVFQVTDSEPAYLRETIQDQIESIESGALESATLLDLLRDLIDPDADQDKVVRDLRETVRIMVWSHPSAPTVTEVIDDMDRIACEP